MRQNIFIFLAMGIVLLFGLNLLTGSVQIPFADVVDILFNRFDGKESWRYIVLENRLPQTLTSMLCGASLAVCGLMLQTAFRNPLAGPDVFGISSGAGLGVALVMLLLGGSVSISTFTVSGFFAILTAAFIGAIGVTALILFLSTLVRNSILLLIVGIMVGYVSSSVVSLLNFFATEDGVKGYMVCTRQMRNILLVVVGLLTAVTTAFCGPVSFIGLAIPHVSRLLFRTENHQTLLPGTVLSGALIALLCNFICYLPGESGIIPLNAVTPLIGAPVIIYVILKRR